VIDTVSTSELVSDLRYALNVMEESSHLGLDDEYARRLHDILQRNIDRASAASPVRSSVPFPISSSSKIPT